MSKLADKIKQLLKEAEGTAIAEPSTTDGSKTTNKAVAKNPVVAPAEDADDKGIVENEEDLSEEELAALNETDGGQGGAGNIQFGTEGGVTTDEGPGSEGTIVPAVSVDQMCESVIEKLKPLVEAAKVAVAPEALNALFEGQADLSDDFKKKVGSLFESAVNDKLTATLNEAVKGLVEVMGAHYKKRLDEEMAIVEGYADEVAAEWLKENQIALETASRVELAESFMGEIKKVFLEHFIEIPEKKVDLFEAFNQRIAKLEEAANLEIGKTQAAQKALKESQKLLAVVKFTKGMTEMQAAKVTTLSESVEFTTEEEFSGKLKSLTEAAAPIPEATAPAAGAPKKDLLEDTGAAVAPTATPTAPAAPTADANIDPVVAASLRYARNSRSNA